MPWRLATSAYCSTASRPTLCWYLAMYPWNRVNLLFFLLLSSSPMYFPERAPPASGEYARSDTLHCRGAHTSARSVSKSDLVIREYEFWMVWMRGSPADSAERAEGDKSFTIL